MAKKKAKEEKVQAIALNSGTGAAVMLSLLGALGGERGEGSGLDVIRNALSGRPSFSNEDTEKLDAAGYVDGDKMVCEMNNTLMLFGGPAKMVFALIAHMAFTHRIPACIQALDKLIPMYEWACDYALGIESIIGHPLEGIEDSVSDVRAELSKTHEKVARLLAGEDLGDDDEDTERVPDED